MTIVAKTAPIVLLSLIAGWGASALGQPPPHAPAHGWRQKQDAPRDAPYAGRTGMRWEEDFDISSGRCNRDAIGAVVGGILGGAIANRVGDENRAVATVIGAAAGALIGHRIGRELDERDRSCFGHALDIGEAGRPVTWTNESTEVRYELVPGADRERNGASCRGFTLMATSGRDKSSQSGLACQPEPGVWQVVD